MGSRVRLVGSRWCEKAEPQAEGKIARAPGPHMGRQSNWELEGPTVSGPVNDTRGRLVPRTGPVSLLLTVESWVLPQPWKKVKEPKGLSHSSGVQPCLVSMKP